jgi:chromosome partitioning protein
LAVFRFSASAGRREAAATPKGKTATVILSVLNQKGGVGKTTVAVTLAAAWAGRGRRVLVVDADPQGSLLDWVAARGDRPSPFAAIGMAKPILHVELPKMKKDFDIIVIDGPPRVYEVARSAVMASDAVLIPVLPSQFDAWAAEETVKLLEECAAYKPALKSAFVINRRIAKTAIGRDFAKALKQYPIAVLSASLGQRVAFSESAHGKTVFEMDPDSLASREAHALATAALKLPT